ncbi:MAG: hypothetical protein WC332_02425, partial [Clostridia bacterium]
MADTQKKYKTIPLTGKLMTADPATIGSNFQTLTNMRYTDTHPKSISGNTKINTTALSTYLKTRNAYHFRKVQPAESHLLVQAYNTGLTASQILQNTTAIPSAGDFSDTAVWTDSAGAGRGYFCNAPDGQLIYANGVDSCIWGGSEMKCGAFISSTAVVADDGTATNPKNFTDAMQNTKTDADNVCHIGGGIDTYTVLMLHGDGADASTTITDSETVGAAKAITAVGNAQLDTAYKKFGSAAVLFDGTGDYLTTPDHADWYFAAAPFTIDAWIYFGGTGNLGICGQYVDANNYWYFRYTDYISYWRFEFKVVSGGVTQANYRTGNTSVSSFSFNHVSLVR